MRLLLTPSCRLNDAVFRLVIQFFNYCLQVLILEASIYFICIYSSVWFLEENKTYYFGIALLSLSHLDGRIPGTWGDHARPSQPVCV